MAGLVRPLATDLADHDSPKPIEWWDFIPDEKIVAKIPGKYEKSKEKNDLHGWDHEVGKR